MKDDYYLINNEIKFYFDIERQCLEFKGNTESLEPKEAQILKYILEHNQDGIINSEAILDDNWDYWNDKKVLQKVLSTLRKKFKSIDVAENGFVAAGSNYKINYVGQIINSQQQQIKEKNAQKHKVMSSIKTAVMWAFAGAVTLLAIIKINESPKFTVDNIIQATAISGVSVEPALSPDGTALAFSHKKENTSQIYLKLDSSLNYEVLTNSQHAQVPAWSPSGRQLAFQRYEKGICEIRLIKLDSNYSKIGNDEKLADCSSYTYLASIAWETETSLFFTQRMHPRGPSEIKHLDLKTKALTSYFTYPGIEPDNDIGSGHYYVLYNSQLKMLFSLESKDWVKTDINIINDDNTAESIQQVENILLSIDIFDSHMIFKDIDNQLKTFALGSPSELTTIYKNPLKPIGYPTISANNNKIAMVSGSVFKNNIYAMSLKNNEVSEIIASQFKLSVPQEVDNEISFTSDETGMNQIYSYSNNIRLQLTNFTKNKRIVHFTLSNDKQWLAISFTDSTVIYKRHDNGLSPVKTFPLMSYPAFSKNGERILLTNLVKSGSADSDDRQTWKKELVEFNVADFSETGITIKNALFGVYHDSGIIYHAAEGGVKLFTLNGAETITNYIGKITRSRFAINKDNIFISSGSKVAKISLKTKIKVELPLHDSDGQITANDNYLFFKNQEVGNMVIFKGELTIN